MDSDAWHFGGKGRVAWDGEHFTTPATEEEGGKFNDRDQYFQVSEGTVCGGARVQGCQVCVLGGGRCRGEDCCCRKDTNKTCCTRSVIWVSCVRAQDNGALATC